MINTLLFPTRLASTWSRISHPEDGGSVFLCNYRAFTLYTTHMYKQTKWVRDWSEFNGHITDSSGTFWLSLWITKDLECRNLCCIVLCNILMYLCDIFGWGFGVWERHDLSDLAHHLNTLWPLHLQAGMTVNALFQFAISVLMNYSSVLWS
jgi:hypothetical protein